MLLEDLLYRHDFDYVETSRQARSTRPELICYEALVGNPFRGAFDSLRTADRLSRRWPDARILITVREPASMLGSLYRQYINEGGTLPPRDFLALRPPAPVYFDRVYLHYDRLCSYYAERFGRSNVCVLPYELLRGHPQDFFLQSWAHGGVCPLDGAPALARRRLNASLSRPALQVLRWSNRWLSTTISPAGVLPSGLFSGTRLRFLLQNYVDAPLLKRMGAEPLRLPVDVVEQVREECAESMGRLAADWNLSLADFGYMLRRP